MAGGSFASGPTDGAPWTSVVDAIGHVPLPPYIRRADRESDRDRYQTMFARAPRIDCRADGGAALHRIGDRRRCALVACEIAAITLHVGYGTFQPVRAERVEEHDWTPSATRSDAAAAQAVNAALDEGRRVIAVGTTTTRTLEAVAAANGGRVAGGRGPDGSVHLPGIPVPGDSRADDELPPAADRRC